MADFTDADLRGARFLRTDLTGAVLRGVTVDDLDIDAPWLLEGGGVLTVNGVDVTGYVDAELNRRFPGRELKRAGDPAGLQAAWAAVEDAWASAIDRAATMPASAVDEQVDGEWSFAQTLRHLVMATDTWLRRGSRVSSRLTTRWANPTWSTTPTATTLRSSPPGRPLRRRARRPRRAADDGALVPRVGHPEVLAETRPNP